MKRLIMILVALGVLLTACSETKPIKENSAIIVGVVEKINYVPEEFGVIYAAPETLVGEPNKQDFLYYKVIGSSMEPTLYEGDFVKIVSKEYKDGDIVIATTGSGMTVVKRVDGAKLISDGTGLSFDISEVIIEGSAIKSQESEIYKEAKAATGPNGEEVPEGYIMLDRSHFEFIPDAQAPNEYNGNRGYYRYIGALEYVSIPKILDGTELKDYYKMFSFKAVKGVSNNAVSATDMSYMFYNTPATTMDLSNLDTSNVTDMSYMFYNNKAITLDLSSFDTSSVTNMSNMFKYSAITTPDLSNFDTSSVTNMSAMFSDVKAPTLDISSFNTSSVTDMSEMFYNTGATYLDLSNFETSNVTNMSSMFQRTSVSELNLSEFNTSKVINMRAMFSGSAALTINTSSFDTSSVTNMELMFTSTKVKQLDLSNFDTSKVINMRAMFDSAQVTTIDISSFDTSNVTNMSKMFYSVAIKDFDLRNFDLTKVADLTDMFGWTALHKRYARTKSDADKLNRLSGVAQNEYFGVISSDNINYKFVPDDEAPNIYGEYRGYFRYIGNSPEVVIPNTIDGFELKDYYYMFRQKTMTKVSNNSTSKVANLTGTFSETYSTSLDLSSFDTSNVTDMSYMFKDSQATSLDLSSFDTSNVTDMSYMFKGSQATTLDLSSFDTSKVTTMYAMFSSLCAPSLDLSNFDTSSVTSMSHMFNSAKIENLNLENFNTYNVLDMSYMFAYSVIAEVDLSSFNTEKVTTMYSMFKNTNHVILNLTSFKVTSQVNTDDMFSGCRAVKGLSGSPAYAAIFNTSLNKHSSLIFSVVAMDNPDYEFVSDNEAPGTYLGYRGYYKYTGESSVVVIPNYLGGEQLTDYYKMFSFKAVTKVSNSADSAVTDMSYMFSGNTSTNLDLSGLNTSDTVTMKRMFANSNFTTLNLSTIDTSKVQDMSYMLYYAAAKTITWGSFDTSSVTDMNNMFGYSGATTLNLQSFDTSNVTDMSYMFYNNKAITLDLSSFDTSNVTDMRTMFYKLGAVTLDLSNFNTSNVTNMRSMFLESKVLRLDLSNFNTSNVTDMQAMFRGSSVTELNISSFDTSKVTTMESMFYQARMTTLDLTGFDTSNVTNMRYMFYGSQATTVDLSSFNTINVTDMESMFQNSDFTYLDLSSFDMASVKNTVDMLASVSACEGKAKTIHDALVLNESKNRRHNLWFGIESTEHPDFEFVAYNSAPNTYALRGFYRYKGSEEHATIPNSIDGYILKDYYQMFMSRTINSVSNSIDNQVTDTREMFAYSTSESLDLSNLHTQSVKTMRLMFYNSKIQAINLLNFNTSEVVDMTAMFSNSKMLAVDLSNFDTSKVTNMREMFYRSAALTINVNSFDTSKVTNMELMFGYTKLPAINLSSFDVSKVTSSSSMFRSTDAKEGYAKTASAAAFFNNTSNMPSKLLFGVRATLPLTTLIMSESWNKEAVKFSIVGDATLSDIKEFQYKLGSGAWTLYPGYEVTAIDYDGIMEVSVKAIDTNNLSSTIVTKIAKVDSTPPQKPTIHKNPLTPTNEPVTVTIEEGLDITSGVLRTEYKIGNNSWLPYIIPLTILTNTTISARTFDVAGNVSEETLLEVDNLVDPNPIITIAPYETSPTNQSITVTATTDRGTLNKTSHTFEENGSFTFIATNGSTTAEKIVTISNIDKVPPIITIETYNTSRTPGPIVVKASTNEGVLNQTECTFTDNGSFTFIATDIAGNTATKTVTISNIGDDSTPDLPPITTPGALTKGYIKAYSDILELTHPSSKAKKSIDKKINKGLNLDRGMNILK